MSPDPTLDPDRTALPTPAPESGESDASDSTQVRTKPRTPGAGTSAPPGALHIPGYEITALIARGGMGAVFAGRDLTLDREVAIKTLLPGAGPDRFVTEAKITARLPHPGVPPVHALGTLPDGATSS
jgi:eukaryotic-like serine/threonine-protein kinase